LHIRLDLSGETDAKVLVDIPSLVVGLAVFDNGQLGDSVAGDGIYERDFQINTPSDITAAVTANILDRAGNTHSQNAETGVVLNTAPTISSVSTSSNVASGEMTITFSTDEPTTTQINYGIDAQNLNINLPIESILTQSHSITLSSLPANQLTFFELVAEDTAGNQSAFNGQGKLAPPPIDGVNADAGSDEIGVSWNKSSYADLSGYKIYRSEDDGQSFVVINNNLLLTENFFVDNNVFNDQEYQYYITVLDVDGNESLPSSNASAIPSLSLQGPTLLNGGIIDQNTVWLASRSPYNINGNVLINESVGLLLMENTKIQFEGSTKHILVKGYIDAHGSNLERVELSGDSSFNAKFEQPVIIYDTYQNSSWNYTTWNQVNIRRAAKYSKVNIDNSIINLADGYFTSLENINNSIVNTSGYTDLIQVSNINSSQLNLSDCPMIENIITIRDTAVIGHAISDVSVCASAIIRASHLTRVTTENYSFNITYNIKDSVFRSSYVSGGSITDSTFNDSQVSGSYIVNSEFGQSSVSVNTSQSTGGSPIVRDSAFNETSVLVYGGTLHNPAVLFRNVFNSGVTINSSHFDARGNYFGTSDFSEIIQKIGYVFDSENKSRLYPIITSADLENADIDSDGIPDFFDHDNDNDGYSDLQEEWSSDETYGSIFNPLDNTSHPGGDIDTDMDGIADISDSDDDGDGLSDADEVNYGTNPLLVDSDMDFAVDGFEVLYKYNPIDGANYPLIYDVSNENIGIENSNSDGVTYLVGSRLSVMDIFNGLTLKNITVTPGSSFMILADTYINVVDSQIYGDSINQIYIDSVIPSGMAHGETLYLENTSVDNAQINVRNFSKDEKSIIINSTVNDVVYGP